jgi:mRNA interferase MazF
MREVARGDIVRLLDDQGTTFAAAVVVQSTVFSGLPSLLVCPCSYEPVDAPLLRVPLGESADTGLPEQAWAMVELLTAVPRDRVGRVVGHVNGAVLRDLDRALVVLLGIG